MARRILPGVQCIISGTVLRVMVTGRTQENPPLHNPPYALVLHLQSASECIGRCCGMLTVTKWWKATWEEEGDVRRRRRDKGGDTGKDKNRKEKREED